MIWYLFLANTAIILFQSYWTDHLFFIHLCALLVHNVLAEFIGVFIWFGSAPYPLWYYLTVCGIAIPYMPLLLAQHEQPLGIGLNLTHIASHIFLYWYLDVIINPISTNICIYLTIIYILILILPINGYISSLSSKISDLITYIIMDKRKYSFIFNIILEILLLYNTMLILNYTLLNSVVFVFAIYCINIYYLYTFYCYLFFNQVSSSIFWDVLTKIDDKEAVDMGFVILYCVSHQDKKEKKRFNHPLLSFNEKYSSQCFKNQYDFMKMDFNDKLEWIEQFNSFKIMYDEYLFFISIFIAHILPIFWNWYSLNIESDTDIVLIENKHEWILIFIINTLYCASFVIWLYIMIFVDKFSISMAKYLIISKVYSAQYHGYDDSPPSIQYFKQFHDNMAVVKVVMDCINPNIATIILSYCL